VLLLQPLQLLRLVQLLQLLRLLGTSEVSSQRARRLQVSTAAVSRSSRLPTRCEPVTYARVLFHLARECTHTHTHAHSYTRKTHTHVCAHAGRVRVGGGGVRRCGKHDCYPAACRRLLMGALRARCAQAGRPCAVARG
jgi:hypothetical protein